MSAASDEPVLPTAPRAGGNGSDRLVAIGREAGHVAHKINNHLTTILTFSHLLHDKSNLDSQDREDLQLIIRETNAAAALARNLQDFSRDPQDEFTEPH